MDQNVTHIPTVTVVLPVYNAARFLAQTIESILAQTFTDFELLVINDGSSDASMDVVRRFQDKRIRIVENPKNMGVIETRNRGAELSRGRYSALMDADDLAHPNRLEKQLRFLEDNPQVDVVASLVELINTDGEVTGTWSTDRETLDEVAIRFMMPRTNCIAQPSVMIRTNVLRAFLYNPVQHGAEDYDLFLRILAARKRIAKIPETLLQYRIHPSSLTAHYKAGDPLEKRLLRFKSRFVVGELKRFRFSKILFALLYSMMRNSARHIIKNKLPVWLRDLKRIFTESPLQLAFERRRMDYILSRYTGNKVFIFPYTHVGGAEQVHADIVRVFSDEKPIVIFSGFSENEKFLHLFESNAQVLNIPALLNHPFTRNRARRQLCNWFAQTEQPVFFGSNAAFFYDMLPLLPENVKSIDLIHAFKHQPGGNLAHLRYLNFMPKLTARVFVSEAARQEFSTFCFHNNMPQSEREKLVLISNAVAKVESSVKPLSHPIGILFVGRNSAEKRLPLFLQSAAKLQTLHPGKFTFTVVGAKQTSPEYGFVNFRGEISDAAAIAEHYAANDVLVLTSSREGFPMVIMEAMMHGLVVIATPVGDIPNRLSAVNSIVLSSASEETVADEIVKTLQQLSENPQQAVELKKAAKQFAEREFSTEKFIRSYQNLLKSGNPEF
jgi:glycosyltransferase involved in cell wall biosynthesis